MGLHPHPRLSSRADEGRLQADAGFRNHAFTGEERQRAVLPTCKAAHADTSLPDGAQSSALDSGEKPKGSKPSGPLPMER
ncbi:hypothetical protein NDU88_003376 [Pleurodeles waltl]|uniref:Uncharacterized protein n=1 Tax=Pleurodeles waltl TaxID=8319 RepID=A0AAV7W5E7_PLEWA|nr:hypothetical protein NDU88_003376 [Pleurodeles waltl]